MIARLLNAVVDRFTDWLIRPRPIEKNGNEQ